MGEIQQLLRRQHRPAGKLPPLHLGQAVLGGPVGAPAGHVGRQRLAVVAPGQVVQRDQIIAVVDPTKALNEIELKRGKIAAAEADHRAAIFMAKEAQSKLNRMESIIKRKAETAGAPREEIESQIRAEIPLGRFEEASEVGAVIAFLASPAAGYVNGINVPVDGGCTQSL